VFENGVWKGLFGAKRDEVTGEWRKLHNEELHELYFSPNNCAGDKIEKNEMGGACSSDGEGKRHVRGFGLGNLRERDHWGDTGEDGRIILR
jgi:hypothetical protein